MGWARAATIHHAARLHHAHSCRLLTPPESTERKTSLARVSVQYILLSAILVAVGLLRVVSYRRQFALTLEADAQLVEYHAVRERTWAKGMAGETG